MLSFIKEKKNCTGCTACKSICPVKCISMIEDEEGFMYPKSDETCIKCNKCEKVCPILNDKIGEYDEELQHAVAAISNNEDVWINSTSGGAFTEICNVYGDNETIVFGAKFDELEVKHSFVIGSNNINHFRKSKYVQSYLGDSFEILKKYLDENKKVIFSGTPCQAAGLKSYLQKDYENLLCIDLICHGVGSPKVFKDSLKYINRFYNKEVIKYDFRYKDKKKGHMDYTTRYEFNNSEEKIADFDLYNQLFLSQLCVRPSCQINCKFRNKKRVSDLTIADFKGKAKIFPYDVDKRNYSTIIINSQKGELVFNNLFNRMKIMPCEMKDIESYNPLFFKQTFDNPLRDNFFSDYSAGMELEKLTLKYVPKQRKKIKNIIKKFIPYKVKLIIIRILK